MTRKKTETVEVELVAVAGPAGQYAAGDAPEDQHLLHLSANAQETLGHPAAIKVAITATEPPEPDDDAEPEPAA